ncbi:hypothetical protein [Fibrobacter sp. UWH1]|uniref:hypothetical protein n=1 Tax=Fibrobacter sp. UWH1 TaxID=1964354 RepID=UPI00117B96EA|nr:hypothetical protein [Fibrobacter sp. UWH1]
MVTGEYPDEMNEFHNPEKNVKMWMAKEEDAPFLIKMNINGKEHQFLSSIPSIEGVFNRTTGVSDHKSYNYGNNYISHTFFDIIPWKFMDDWFKNP